MSVKEACRLPWRKPKICFQNKGVYYISSVSRRGLKALTITRAHITNAGDIEENIEDASQENNDALTSS